MKIKWGSLVADGRGKIGGHVASKNRAGAYLRSKVTPVNPRSASQINARQRLATLAIAWRGITAAQRIAWNASVGAFAGTDIFGDLRKPTGFNLYCRLNANLALVGVAAISDPPLPVAVGSLVTMTPTQVHAGATSIAYTVSPTLAGMQLVIRATAPVSPGKSFVKSELRVIANIAPAAASPFVATATYAAKFGGPGLAGQKVFFEAFYIHLTTGQKGLPLQASCIVS
jgi:hypothetical protein